MQPGGAAVPLTPKPLRSPHLRHAGWAYVTPPPALRSAPGIA